jgi:hypothetical protein
MRKLYTREPTGEIRYHEAWISDGQLVEHWGVLGKRGQTKEHVVPSGMEEGAALVSVLGPAEAAGFAEIDDLRTLIIEYALDSWGSVDDLQRRTEVEERMSELLGWTGLGHCDGGSIGSGTMEVCCLVVDFEIARRVIEEDLRGSPLASYARIYDEGA